MKIIVITADLGVDSTVELPAVPRVGDRFMVDHVKYVVRSVAWEEGQPPTIVVAPITAYD